MNLETLKIECPRSEIAAYIDGELLPREELELETHVANCRLCASELNEQKRLLRAIDYALENEFKLPENFTRVVVANAESRVSGLRSPKERFNAVFVISALFLMFLLGLGGEVKTVSATFVQFGEHILTVANFSAHLIYKVGVGISIVLRSIGAQFAYNSSGSIVFLTVFFFASLMALSRFTDRFKSI